MKSYEEIFNLFLSDKNEEAEKEIKTYHISREALLSYLNATRKGQVRKKIKEELESLREEVFSPPKPVSSAPSRRSIWDI